MGTWGWSAMKTTSAVPDPPAPMKPNRICGCSFVCVVLVFLLAAFTIPFGLVLMWSLSPDLQNDAHFDDTGEIPDQNRETWVHPLSKHLRAGIGKAMRAPITMRHSVDGHQFARFDTHGTVNTSAFRDTILRLESSIIGNTKPRDGLYALIKDDSGDARPRLTSRSDRYNVFLFDEPWVGDYFWLIKRAFHKYIEAYSIAVPRPLFIKSWANCFRRGQYINWHEHGRVHSGTFFVAVPGPADPSNTSYMLKGEIFNLVNTMGELVLFSGEGTPHRSSNLTEQQVDWLANEQASECRITSSFDISADPHGIGHSVPFFDPEDPYFERDPSTANLRAYGNHMLQFNPRGFSGELDDEERSEDEENYQNNGEGGNHEEGEFTQQQVEEGSEDEEDEEGEEGEGADTIWDRKLAAALESNGAKEFVLQQEL